MCCPAVHSAVLSASRSPIPPAVHSAVLPAVSPTVLPAVYSGNPHTEHLAVIQPIVTSNTSLEILLHFVIIKIQFTFNYIFRIARSQQKFFILCATSLITLYMGCKHTLTLRPQPLGCSTSQDYAINKDIDLYCQPQLSGGF